MVIQDNYTHHLTAFHNIYVQTVTHQGNFLNGENYKTMWPNRIGRPTPNREVAGSSPAMVEKSILIFEVLEFFVGGHLDV